MATVSAFFSRVRRELEEASESAWSDESLLDWANDAIRDFADRVKLGFDEQYASSVANQESYEMPDRTIDVVRVAYNGSFLQRLTERDFFVFSTTAPDSGTPLRYAVLEGVLYLHPKPAVGGNQIRVWRRFRPAPIESVSSTEEMPFGSDYNDALSFAIKARAWEQVGDFESAKINDQLYQREVDDAIWRTLDESTGDYYHEPVVVW